jgi:hypothetical protein
MRGRERNKWAFFKALLGDGVTWIGVAQNRVQCQAFVKAVLKFRVL